MSWCEILWSTWTKVEWKKNWMNCDVHLHKPCVNVDKLESAVSLCKLPQQWIHLESIKFSTSSKSYWHYHSQQCLEVFFDHQQLNLECLFLEQTFAFRSRSGFGSWPRGSNVWGKEVITILSETENLKRFCYFSVKPLLTRRTRNACGCLLLMTAQISLTPSAISSGESPWLLWPAETTITFGERLSNSPFCKRQSTFSVRSPWIQSSSISGRL